MLLVCQHFPFFKRQRPYLDGQFCRTIADNVKSISDDETSQQSYEEREEAVSKMSRHVDCAAAQRCYFNARSKECKNSANEPHDKRQYCIVADYSQNLQLPHFGEEQPGETYYYCPLNVAAFGVVDCQNDHLSAYVYHEGEGKKGGNNVSSLLMKYCKEQGWFDKQTPGMLLTIVMDNCCGQNKNRMVLRAMALYLVEKKVFNKVEVIFLVPKTRVIVNSTS